MADQSEVTIVGFESAAAARRVNVPRTSKPVFWTGSLAHLARPVLGRPGHRSRGAPTRFRGVLWMRSGRKLLERTGIQNMRFFFMVGRLWDDAYSRPTSFIARAGARLISTATGQVRDYLFALAGRTPRLGGRPGAPDDHDSYTA